MAYFSKGAMTVVWHVFCNEASKQWRKEGAKGVLPRLFCDRVIRPPIFLISYSKNAKYALKPGKRVIFFQEGDDIKILNNYPKI